MVGLINSSQNKYNKQEKPTLRILRSFPNFWKKTLVIYFPRSVGSGFSYLPLAGIYDSHVSVKAVDVDKEGEDRVKHYEVRSSKRLEPIILMKTEAEAVEVVRRLSSAIAPSRMKWVYIALGVVVLYAFLTSGSSAPRAPVAPALSIHTPMTPRAVAPVAPAVITPSPASPSFAAPVATPAPKAADANDPFGLKLAPEAAK